MVRNEISVLKRVSAGHKNIVQLHDFFETTHNLYVSVPLLKAFREAQESSFADTLLGCV